MSLIGKTSFGFSRHVSAHCEDLGNDAQLHVTDNWLDTRNENGEKSLILLQKISVCLRLCRVQFRGERISSRPSSAVTGAWRADESSSGDIILSCERDSFKSFSIISDLRDGGLDFWLRQELKKCKSSSVQ